MHFVLDASIKISAARRAAPGCASFRAASPMAVKLRAILAQLAY